MIFFVFGIKKSIFATIILLSSILAFHINYAYQFSGDEINIHSYFMSFMIPFSGVCVGSALLEYSREHTQAILVQAKEQMERHARTDILTGLLNRRGAYDSLENEWQRAKRSGTVFSILICDVDHFKRVNDQFGHQCGDYVLQQLANIFRNNLRKQDILCRWGGEEFLFILPVTGQEGAQNLAEKLRQTIEQTPITYCGQTMHLTVSLGVQECSSDNSSASHIHNADHKLYLAKKQGRNRVIGT